MQEVVAFEPRSAYWDHSREGVAEHRACSQRLLERDEGATVWEGGEGVTPTMRDRVTHNIESITARPPHHTTPQTSSTVDHFPTQYNMSVQCVELTALSGPALET